MRLEFDDERTMLVLTELLNAWQLKDSGFDGFVSPEQRLHPGNIASGTIRHAQLLLGWAILTRFGQPSNLAMADFAEAVVKHPALIDPNEEWSVETEEALYQLTAYMPNRELNTDEEFQRKLATATVRVGGWKANLEFLRAECQGDPRKLFDAEPLGRDALVKSLTRLHGIGHKIAQLLIIWFQQVENWDDERPWETIRTISVIPVDLWVLRFVRQFGILTAWDYDHHTGGSRIISDYLSEFCHEHALPHGDISQALWHCGAQICRKKKPKADPAEYCLFHCPANGFCDCIVTSPRIKFNGTMGWSDAVPRRKIVVS